MAKQASGYAKRTLAKKRANESAEAEQARRDAGIDRMKIEAPPKDPMEAMLYAQRACMEALHRVVNDPVMTFENQLRYISDFTKAIGLTHAKAMVDKRVLDLEKNMGVAKNQHDDDGLVDDPEDK